MAADFSASVERWVRQAKGRPVRVLRVMATDTTADDIVGLY